MQGRPFTKTTEKASVRAFETSDNPSKGFFFPEPSPSSNKVNLPSWTKYPLKTFSRGVKYSAGVILDNYLIVLAQGKKSDAPPGPFGLGVKEELTASFLAFNLLDHSVQETEIDPSSSLVSQQDSFTLLKYGENQIVIYGNNLTYIITVESFEPLKVKCEEEISDDAERKFSKRTAQIYKDCLYVYGKIGEVKSVLDQWPLHQWPLHQRIIQKEVTHNVLCSFDLKNRTWKLCETKGEAPTGGQEELRSFIFQDNLCIYGVVEKLTDRTLFSQERLFWKDLLMLNFDSMEWIKIEQIEQHLEPTNSAKQIRPCGTLYNDHFMTLNRPTSSSTNKLCFLDIHSKTTWSTFDIEGVSGNYAACTATNGGLLNFKNSVLTLTSSDYDKHLSVAILDLLSFGITAPQSEEEKYTSSLFMSQEKSDVAFKVEEKVIPAHKEILIGKSKYFAGLFSSNMAESKQDVIEIADCEYEIFKEYLHFVYRETVSLHNENQAMKLYVLADKYLKEDLRQKCLSFLISIVNMENLYTILDFAQKEDLPQVRSACRKCFQNKLSVENVIELVNYLEKQTDPELKEENKELEIRAFQSVLYYFFEIGKKGKEVLQICEDFVLKNINMKTILDLSIFLATSHQLSEEESSRIIKKIFEEKTVRIREATYNFVHENVKIVMTSKTAKSFPAAFFTDYILASAERKEAGRE